MSVEILPNIFQIEVPLPDNPLRVMNSYLVRGDRDLLLDTGFNLDACEQSLRAAFQELGVREDRLDIFITHCHTDHIALLPRLYREGMNVYSGVIPWALLQTFDQMEGGDSVYLRRLAHYGLTLEQADESQLSRPEFSTHWGKLRELCEYQVLSEGETLRVGDYALEVVATDGHCDGHLCLYEPQRKFLFSGDHILNHVSPNITCYDLEATSSLQKYLANLDKVAALDIDLILPGHRSLITNHRQRIAELKAHHRDRVAEITDILRATPLPGVAIASRMHWAVHAAWHDFPIAQKYFALGEVIAHLNYMKEIGKISVREQKDGEIIYSLN